jgi:hypothetical protein
MPIEELRDKHMVLRCAVCDARNVVWFEHLKVGLGGLLDDDIDPQVVRTPACGVCRGEELLVRSSAHAADHPWPGSREHRHMLLVDRLHSILAESGRVHPAVDARAIPRVTAEALRKWFGPRLAVEPDGAMPRMLAAE